MAIINPFLKEKLVVFLQKFILKGRKNMLNDYTDYLTPYEISEEFGLSLTTIYNLLRSKKIPGFKIGRSWRIPRDAMEDYIYGE